MFAKKKLIASIFPKMPNEMTMRKSLARLRGVNLTVIERTIGRLIELKGLVHKYMALIQEPKDFEQ